MDDKKKYVNPEAEIVELVDGDIITLSELGCADGTEEGETM